MSHREKLDADSGAAKEFSPALRSFLRQFNPKDVFNADEFELFYKQAATRTVTQARLLGRQVNKDRSTFLPCCDTKGSERLPPFVVEGRVISSVLVGRPLQHLNWIISVHQKSG